jgi:lactonase
MFTRRRSIAFVITMVAAVATGCAAVPASAPSAAGTNARPAVGRAPGAVLPRPRVIVASRVTKVTPLDPAGPFGHVTLLEGPAFGPDGQLYFVNLTAPAGQPKVLKLNLKTGVTTPVYTDSSSSFSSLQFSPLNGKVYLTDLFSGNLYEMNSDGTDFTTIFSGPIDGRTMAADDIAFNPAGDLYVSDTAGTPWNLIGRVVRFNPDGTDPTVLQDNLAGANGISFSPDFSSLWVSEFTLGREDHFSLSADGTSITTGNVGMTANMGTAGFDSNTVDAAGNVYQCEYPAGRIMVWNSLGDLLATIVIPQNLPLPQMGTTNLAIKPGTTHGYITVGGENGGYIYSFTALAKGIPQSNGGGA